MSEPHTDPAPGQSSGAPAETALPVGTGSSRADAFATSAFKIVEHVLLITIALMTLGAAGMEVARVVRAEAIDLADILLMFLYTEVIGMIAVFYTGRGGSPFVYPIFIAITALARLIVLQGKAMAPENIVFEASAILLLALSVVIILRAGREK